MEEEKKIYGRIYCITNLINGKQYVGQTIKKISYRFNEHARANSPLGEDIRKYGRENFKIDELEKCYSYEELNAAEKKWIKELNCKVPNGYNRTDGGDGLLNPVKGIREKLVEAGKGNKRALGRKHTEDEKRKIRESNLGQKRTPETCEKLRQINTGLKATQSTKDKMSAKRKGRKFTQEHRDNLSASHKARWEKFRKKKENKLKNTKQKDLQPLRLTVKKRKPNKKRQRKKFRQL